MTELEILRMQLAACGVLALSNTEDSLKQNYQMKPEYKCASVDDVAAMARREINLIKENAELKAQNKDLLGAVTKCSKLYSINPEFHFELQELIKRTPQQSLANIQADAIENMINDYFSSKESHTSYSTIRTMDCIDYANKLRGK